MKIRQRYFCDDEEVCIKYVYNKLGIISEFIEVGSDTPFDKDEYTLPKIEVTDDMFFKIINNPRLK